MQRVRERLLIFSLIDVLRVDPYAINSGGEKCSFEDVDQLWLCAALEGLHDLLGYAVNHDLSCEGRKLARLTNCHLCFFVFPPK